MEIFKINYMALTKILKISAPWCSMCKQLKKELSDWDGIPIVEFDADEDEEICIKYNIRSLPTLLFVDESEKEIGRKVGMITKKQIQDYINTLNE